MASSQATNQASVLRAEPAAPQNPPEPTHLDTTLRRRGRRRRARWTLLIAGPLALVIAAAWFYVTGGRYVATDDAFVKTDMVSINAEVDGQVTVVHARDNQQVKTGDLLFAVDPRSYEIALQQARADLAQMSDQIAALRASYQGKQVALKQSRDTIAYLQREFQRQSNLAGHGYASQQKYDEARHNLDQARQQADMIRQQMAEIEARLGGAVTTPTQDLPQYKAALARRDAAALALARTKIHAPADGVLANVTLRPGDYVKSGAPAFTLAETDHLWVVANFKETELTHVGDGQAATVTADAYPGVTWRARVESLSPASGNEFSLLPPQNASGNWVKVVQRIPVRVEIVPQPGAPRLRAGMSVTVEIDTHHHRPMPSFLAKLVEYLRAA